MFEPFIWMFKTENFKKHFFYLLFMIIKFFFLTAVMGGLAFIAFSKCLLIPAYICGALAFFFFIAPCLGIQGYFWCLTEQIISRDWDIVASRIYDGKIKNVFKVTLPDLQTSKFVWRGIASIVATMLMMIPFVVLMTSGTLLTAFSSLPMQTVLVLYVFISLFIPALLWNYATRDSVFAVWNIRKAIYIMGNYTGKYFLNVFLFIIFYVADYFLLAFLAYVLGVNSMNAIMAFDIIAIIKIILFYLISYVQYIYGLYVYAYLLGTIAPPCEG